MCGIAGIVKFKKKKNVEKTEIIKMLEVMRYRGPDDAGIFLDATIGLGHLRLSIIDLSFAGHQPMDNCDKDLVIIYNGEIYNYIEIRDKLKMQGRIFNSSSDTEVILQAYEQWGEECVKEFNGMWAFVIYDKKTNKLFCSRDRFGVKPFFYCFDDQEFIFASEMKAILQVRPHLRKPNYDFLYNFIDRNTPFQNKQTVFLNIFSLLPGYNLTIDLESGSWNLKSHWQFDEEGFQKKYDYEKPAATLREILIDAVKLRLRSDVPVGICLSGGLDSSIIACIISKIFGMKVDTFSSVYPQVGYNEEPFVDIVNNWCDARPHKISPSTRNFIDILYKIIFHHDQPVRMPSCYSQWHVMHLAKDNGVKVLLDGQGGDELLGGYVMYFSYYLRSLVKNALLEDISGNFKEFVSASRLMRKDFFYSFKDVCKVLLPDPLMNILRIFKKEKIWQDEILSVEFKKKVVRYQNNYPIVSRDPLNQELFRTFFGTNLPMILDYEDRLSMAFSLESRTPMLDYRFVEFCFGLPRRYKIQTIANQIITKRLLRESFQDILPTKISRRKDKKGFPTPNEYWFRHELSAFMREMIHSSSFRDRGFFDPQATQRLFIDHIRGKDNSRLLWRMLTVEMWFRQYFD